MASALQQQLSAIAAKTTHALDLKAQRAQHGKSLLFEPRDAAAQTFDTIFQICLEGFEELCMLDPKFNAFAQNLFSEQSKDEDRTQMSAAQNEELDTVIKSFLALVGGRLLLKPGQKAVEWLVRRFQVHEYNTDWLILTFLPYHTSSIFPSLLSILPKTLPPAFRFLQPYVTSLTNPPRPAVLHAAINNPGFFSQLNQYTITVAKQGYQSAVQLGFWASLTAQALHGQLEQAQSGRADVRRQREEDLLLQVIPLLQQTLRIRNAPELYLGSCMIITILVSKTQLEDKVLDSLMDAVAKFWSAQTLDEGLTSLCIIAEERQAAKLPRQTARVLLVLTDLSRRLERLSQRQRVQRLQLGLALAAVDELGGQRVKEALDAVSSTFARDLLTNQQKVAVMRSFFTALTNANMATALQAHKEYFTDIVVRLFELPKTRDLAQEAADASNVDVALLETLLRVPLRPPPTSDGSTDEDVEMAEEPTEGSGSLIEDALSGLPGSLPPDYSFFEVDKSDFGRFFDVFVLVLQSRYGMEQLLQHPALQSQHAFTRPAYLTFCLRLAVSRSPGIVRSSGLRAAVQRVQEGNEDPVDMQGIIQFALVGLADVSQPVRRAAADLLIGMERLYQANNGKVPANIKIWAQDDLYDNSTRDLRWLSSQDAYMILSTILVPKLEECVLDPLQAARVLKDAMEGTSSTTSEQSMSQTKELKTSARSALYTFICSHACVNPILTARYEQLLVLSNVGKTGNQARVEVLVPSLKKWAALPENDFKEAERMFGTEATNLTKEYLNCLTSRTSEELDCLKDLASGRTLRLRDTVTALRRFQRMWPAMKTNAQVNIGLFLLEHALNDEAEEAASTRQTEALEVLRNVNLSTEVLSAFLESVPDIAQMQDNPPAAKRRRTSKSESSRMQSVDQSQLQSAVRRLTLVLELVEASKPERHTELLKNMFHVLGELQNYRMQMGSDLVYLQGMTIGSLLAIVDALKSSPNSRIDRMVLRADLVVECVRSTASTQVHNAALLLISSLATWAPDLVLHSVMPIFTFMSTTLLRQSDDYSAHVIDQTVSRVVPPLAASLRKNKQDLVTGAAELLLSFTAAFEHIPLHRRLRLFSHLADALGPDDSLYAIIAMLAEKYPTDKMVPSFSAELMNAFDPIVQLTAASKYLDLVSDALKPRRTFSEAVLGFNDKSADQIEGSISHLLASLAKLLENRPLHSKIGKALKQDSNEAESVRTASSVLLQKIMSLAKELGDRSVFARPCDTLLSAGLGLLPTQHFVRSAQSLLENPDESLRVMVFRSLEKRLQSARIVDAAIRDSMLAFLPTLTAAVKDMPSIALKHGAILCIDQINEKYGKKEAGAVLSAAEVIASESALGSTDESLRIISLLCLASMVDTLRDDIVPLTPRILERAFSFLDATVSDSVASAHAQGLHDAVYAFVNAVLEHLPWMLSADMLDRLLRLTYRSAASETTGHRGAETRSQFADLICKQVDAQAMLTALDKTFEAAMEDGHVALNELLLVLYKVVTSHPKAVLVRQAQTFFSVLMKTFDVRRLLSLRKEAELDAGTISVLDNKRDEIALEAVMRLNDSVFRPFFVRLVEWATAGLPKSDTKGRLLRSASLYGFLSRFFEQLKSIVTSYSGYFLEHAAATLSSTLPDSDDKKSLLKNVLETLLSSFRHDQDDFWQAPAHFSAISEPLLKQLSHAKQPEIRDSLGVVDTITELAVASASPEHHKELNAAILRLMRVDDALVRLAAVKCEQSLTERLGEDWLGLLPEMLPFISELQEDDDEVVERETLAWIRRIESILGESLEGMLQ